MKESNNMKKSVVLETWFWEDFDGKRLTAEQRNLLAYLMTGSVATQCGIVKIDIARISMETGYSEQMIEFILRILEVIGEIIISEETNELIILDMVWYIPLDNQKVMRCVAEELEKVSSQRLRDLFYHYWTVTVGNKAAD
jgi:predicted transcriptional regulator